MNIKKNLNFYKEKTQEKKNLLFYKISTSYKIEIYNQKSHIKKTKSSKFKTPCTCFREKINEEMVTKVVRLSKIFCIKKSFSEHKTTTKKSIKNEERKKRDFKQIHILFKLNGLFLFL